MYYYQVGAVTSLPAETKSLEQSVVPARPPDAPNLSAAERRRRSDASLVVGTAERRSTDHVVPDLPRHVVGRREHDATGDRPRLATPVFDDTTVTNGVTYYYKVAAVNLAGQSALSNERSAVPVGPPSPPIVTVTPHIGSVHLAWSVANDGGSPITGFTISRAVLPATPAPLPGPGPDHECHRLRRLDRDQRHDVCVPCGRDQPGSASGVDHPDRDRRRIGRRVLLAALVGHRCTAPERRERRQRRRRSVAASWAARRRSPTPPGPRCSSVEPTTSSTCSGSSTVFPRGGRRWVADSRRTRLQCRRGPRSRCSCVEPTMPCTGIASGRDRRRAFAPGLLVPGRRFASGNPAATVIGPPSSCSCGAATAGSTCSA